VTLQADTDADAEERSKAALTHFRISEKYSITLFVMFLSLFYSSAVPLLLGLVFVFALGKYWVDRHDLVVLSTTPPMLDERLAAFLEDILPLAGALGTLSHWLVHRRPPSPSQSSRTRA
jgi:hypothetical protein